MNPTHFSSKERFCNGAKKKKTKKTSELGKVWLMMRNAIPSHQTRADGSESLRLGEGGSLPKSALPES